MIIIISKGLKFLEHMSVSRLFNHTLKRWAVVKGMERKQSIPCEYLKCYDGNTIAVNIPECPWEIGNGIAIRIRGIEAEKTSIFNVSDIQGLKNLEPPFTLLGFIRGNKEKIEKEKESAEVKRREIENLCKNAYEIKLKNLETCDYWLNHYDGYISDYGFIIAEVILFNADFPDGKSIEKIVNHN